ncbi:MAG: S8 family serine peptidase, partial [SAR324 cluster bacterium]|nr:S8 family serine peptidase [SAR324 cluster bacterium]
MVILAWVNPTETDFTGVLILRRDDGESPIAPDDADAIEVYDGTEELITDSGLSNGTTYYYAAYAHDSNLNYSDGVAASATPVAAAGGGGGVPTNAAPVANAGPDQNVDTGSLVTLDGSASSDADGDSLAYLWGFTSLPGGSSAVLSDATAVNPAFTPDLDGAYVLALVVNDGSVDSAASTVTIVATSGDPLFQYQWHMVNTGQTAFSDTPGVPGEDINMAGTYAAGIKGLGVKVAVVDTGLEIAHEDLSPNVIPGASWDFVGSDSDPTNTSETEGDHGTSVAGLIAARDSNDLGGRGVASRASLVGYNLL